MKKILIYALTLLTISSAMNYELFASELPQSYQDAKVAYDNAKSAQDKINQSIIDIKNAVESFPADKITYDDFKNNPAQISDWLKKYNSAYDSLIAARDIQFPLLAEYQSKLDVYNNSGNAPANNPKIAFEANDFLAKVNQIITEVDSAMNQNVSQTESYNKYFTAKLKFENDHKEYEKAWSAGNPGDPNNDLQNTWAPIINSYGDKNYASLGFSNEELKQTYGIEELNKVISAYVTKGDDAVKKINTYGNYLLTVADKWNKNCQEFDQALAEFNAATGSSTNVFHYPDILTFNAESMMELAEFTVTKNSTYLQTNCITRYNDRDDVYTHLTQRCYSAFGASLGARGTDFSVISGETDFVAQPVNIDFSSISPVEVYELLPPENATINSPNTGETGLNGGAKSALLFTPILLGIMLFGLKKLKRI